MSANADAAIVKRFTVCNKDELSCSMTKWFTLTSSETAILNTRQIVFPQPSSLIKNIESCLFCCDWPEYFDSESAWK